MLDLAAANWKTGLGAACFLACALDTLHTDRASKMPIRRRLRRLERQLDRRRMLEAVSATVGALVR